MPTPARLYAPHTAGTVRLAALTKTFGTVPAVDGIDLDIPAGEFFSLLGPSGCGKTTTLRMIAGFEEPTSGEILLDDTDVAQTPPHRRPVNTVFQNYALFPFMSVADNVAFGLRYQKCTKDDAARRVEEVLALVRLSAFADRKPSQLSGGQQQRVALARGLVLDPKVLLLDEPLGALDAQLRKELQVELKALQERVGITFIYVTHDQEEALTMSDRLAVMAEGRIEQSGTPREVYEQPATAFVAAFLGAANLLRIESREPGQVLLAGQGLAVTGAGTVLMVRPERVHPDADGPIDLAVERVMYLGAAADVHCRTRDDQPLVVRLAPDQVAGLRPGDRLNVAIAPEAARLVPPGAHTGFAATPQTSG
jgi:spermidine/putrescine transport system ATP-binding protein